jgi:urease accessory protein
VHACAALTAEADAGGRTRLTLLRSQAPLVLRPAADAVYLAAGAAGPLGGDELDLTVSVGPDACLTMRTVAATVALPGGSRRTDRSDDGQTIKGLVTVSGDQALICTSS